MTSSLRNSLHRRNHKERSQLAHRSRLGILEKHSDYVQRARDYHSKQDRLTRLKQKAAERNKDEFYFSMNKEKTQNGVHIKDRGNTSLPIDIVKVLKTQDENYVRTMRTTGLKKIEKIKNQLTAMADLVSPALLGGDDDEEEEGLEEAEIETLKEAGLISRKKGGNPRKSKHIVFVENADQVKQYAIAQKSLKRQKEDESMDMGGSEESLDHLGWKVQEKRKGKRKLQERSKVSQKKEDAQERREVAKQHRKHLLKELSARLFRDKQLRYAERELEMQRLLMGKGGRRKLKGVEMVEGEEREDDEDEDELDSRHGRAKKPGVKAVDEKLWKPRVYKWRSERKK